MSPVSKKRKRKTTLRINYAEDARALNCTRQHLRMVLIGERQSDALLQRWLALDQARRKSEPITHSAT